MARLDPTVFHSSSLYQFSSRMNVIDRLNLSLPLSNVRIIKCIIRSIDHRIRATRKDRGNFEFAWNSCSIGGRQKANGRKRLESKHRREISSCNSFVIFRARVPSSWRIKIPERSHRPGAYANDFRGKRVRRVRSPFVPTRIQKSIYIYDVSGLDDTATGYAGLEASRGWQEQNGGGVRRKKGRKGKTRPREK